MQKNDSFTLNSEWTLTDELSESIVKSLEFSDEAWSIKDEKNQKSYTNKPYLTLLNTIFSHSEIDKLFTDNQQHHEDLVKQLGKRVPAFATLNLKNNETIKTYLVEKTPLYDSDHHYFGMITHVKDISTILPSFFINEHDYGHFVFSPPNHLLTHKEWLVTYLLLIGMSTQQISVKLHRTVRTIKFHKANIFMKTNCNNLEEFKKYAFERKWHFYIPNEFVPLGYFILQ